MSSVDILSAIRLDAVQCELPVPATVRFRWTDVEEVLAVSRPAGDDELLTLQFRLRHGGLVEVDERVDGFTQLVEALPAVLPGFPDRTEWLYDVTGGDPFEAVVIFRA